MKRLHVHVSVKDIDTSVGFYSVLFDQEPEVLKKDYAKWLLDDPALNFAISNRGKSVGLNHLGLQVEKDCDLQAIEDRLNAAELKGLKQENANCCYARSNKYWTTDPANIPWENFKTLDSIPVFGEDTDEDSLDSDSEACGCDHPATRAAHKVASCCKR